MKNAGKKFTVNYNGELIKPGEVMVPFEYTELDAENCINPECIKTLRQGGKSFKVIYKAVLAAFAKKATSALNLIQNEALGHYRVKNSVSMDSVKDEYDLELDSTPSVLEELVEKETLEENIKFFNDKMTLLIEKAPKIGYAILLVYSNCKGDELASKLYLKHDGANKVRRVAAKILKDGLYNTIEMEYRTRIIILKFGSLSRKSKFI